MRHVEFPSFSPGTALAIPCIEHSPAPLLAPLFGRPPPMDRIAEILLVEDEEIDRQIVHELVALRGKGKARVTEAVCFKAGLDLLRTHRFDLVLLDTRLQEISALSALRTLGEAS